MATGESTAVKHIDGFERAGDALVDGVKKVGLRFVGEMIPFGSHIPAVRRQLEEDVVARRQEWYNNLTPERRARFDAYVAEDGTVLKAAGQQHRELLTMFPDMPGGPGEEQKDKVMMTATTPGLITGYGPIHRLGQLPRGHFVPNYRLADKMLQEKGGRWDSLNRKAKFKILRETGLQKDPVSNGEWTYVPPEFPRLDARQWASAGLESPYKANVQAPLEYQIAYPLLYKIPVKATKVDNVLKVSGTYHPRPGSIDVSGLTLHDANKILAHELAHYTEDVAGLPRGGSSSLRKQVMAHPGWYGQDAYEKAIRFQKIRSPRGYEQLKYLSPERLDRLTQMDEFIQGLYDSEADYTFYRMLSGEVRARAAESMSRVPAKERMNVLLEDFMPTDTGNFVNINQDAKGGEASDVHSDAKGGDSVRAVEEQPVEEQPVEEQPVEEQPVEEQPARNGGPRIVINPTTFKNQKDALCVAFNEAFRVVMEYIGFDPLSRPTYRQRRFFSDTAYSNDENMLRRTILARIATFDTSVKDPTDEQVEETVEFLQTVLEEGIPQNDWEKKSVQNILNVLQEGLDLRTSSAQKEPAQEEPAQEEPAQEEPSQEEPSQEEPAQEERADANGGQVDEEEDLSDGDLDARELSDGDLSEAGHEDLAGTAAEFRFAGTMNKFFIDNAMEKMVRGDMYGGKTDDEPGKSTKGDTGDLANPPQPGTESAPVTKTDKVEPKDVTGNDTVEVFGNGFGQAATGTEKNVGLGAQAPAQAPAQDPTRNLGIQGIRAGVYRDAKGVWRDRSGVKVGKIDAARFGIDLSENQAPAQAPAQASGPEQGVGNKRAQAKGIHKDGNNYVDANGRRIGFSDYSWYGLS